MLNLTVSLLGPFQITLDGHSLLPMRSNKAQALLAYLLTEERRLHSREGLMALLWPGLPLVSAQVNLRQTLYQLRKAIPEVEALTGDGFVPLLNSDRKTIGLHAQANYELDVDHFKQLSQIATTSDALAQTMAHYGGPFLTDFYLPDSDLFESWARQKRAEFQQLALDTLDRLISLQIEQKQFLQAKEYVRWQLDVDSLHEIAYQQLLRILVFTGQRNAALAEYDSYCRLLRQELDAPPSAEMVTLYERIRANTLIQEDIFPSEPVSPVFCFIDLEGYTRLLGQHGEAMISALQTYQAIVQAIVQNHNGRLLGEAGDAYLVVFEHSNPLTCLLEIQYQLTNYNWGEIGPLRVNMGLHRAEADEEGLNFFRRGADYFGEALHTAVRLENVANGGQILATEGVVSHFAAPPLLTWDDLGVQSLKSISKRHRIYLLKAS